jgi:hypothetical protein
MGRNKSTARKAVRKATRNNRKTGNTQPCQCQECLFDRHELGEGIYIIRDVLYFVTDCNHHVPMFEAMYQNFRKKEWNYMADGDKIVQIDDSDPYNAAIKNLRIEKNMICYAPGCSNTINIKRCSGCRRVRYCSEECQLTDWQNHKTCCEPRLQLPIDE